MSIYTRAGDKGKTHLYQGKIVLKSSLRVEAIGSVDELNSAIGVSIAEISNIKYQIANIKEELIKVQNDLFDIGANLANPSSKALRLSERVQKFENIIDDLTKKLPQLKNFILPGGSLAGSQLHFARTVARRAERRIVELSEKESVENSIIIYMNRLSDLLFMFAREINHLENKKEVHWNSR